MADKTSMLIVVTPDGVSHGQRLTDREAVELTRRLLYLRKGNGGRRPGAGRPPITLNERETEQVLQLRATGMGIRAIARELGLSETAVGRTVKKHSNP